MPVIQVEQIEDPRLDDYRNVSDAALLRQRRLFVAEGRLVVRRLLSSGHRVVSLLLNEPSFKSLEADFADAFHHVPVYVCPTAALAGIVGFNFHRGCLALAQRQAEAVEADITRDAALLLVLEGVMDPDNVGGAFRNAAAFGVDGVLLSACCDPLYRKAVRTSMGHVLRVPHARIPDLAGGIAALKSSGITVMALTPSERATPLPEFVRSTPALGRIALLVGSEAEGLSAVAEAGADVCVRIPMHRGVDSLNVATAIGIALDRLTNR